jgi:sigma-B regulation protein RsbU (phosphoserine phosphatase)
MLLRRRLLLLFVAVVVGVLVSGVLAGLVIRERDRAQSRERSLSVAVERSTQLAAAYVDEETGERGYVLTGERSLLDPYTQGRRRVQQLLRELRETPGASQQLPALLAATAAAGDRWRTGAAEREIAARDSGGPDAAAAVASGEGKTLFDQLRAHLATLAANVSKSEASAARHLDSVRVALNTSFAIIVGLALIGALVAAFLIRRWVEIPIDGLAGEVRRVRAGALDSPISETGPPELARLAADVDAMRDRIREQLLESERSRQAVEQSAAVVLTLRSQLEPGVGPLPRGWTVAGALRAAEGVVAGDCYDLFVMKDQRLALLVVDIAGHGATEGILALRCKEVLRASLTAGNEPGEAIGLAADQLGNMGLEVFLTAFVAVIDTADGRVRYANAGHPPGYVITEDAAHELGPTGPLVGLLTSEWATAETYLPPGANLCVYTDGVVESRSPRNEFFGPARLVGLLQGARCDEAPAVVKRCLDEIDLFSPAGLRDDATIVVLCRPGVD